METYGGGSGGRAFKDGKDGVQVHITNTSNLPVEALESEYPLFIDRYELIPDSGGVGKFRGGLGLRRDIRILDHSSKFSAQGERFVLAPWGLFGGEAGQTGRILLQPEKSDETYLPSKCSGVTVKAGETISIQTPGAGGYGQPKDRDKDLIENDLITAKITSAKARVYNKIEN